MKVFRGVVRASAATALLVGSAVSVGAAADQSVPEAAPGQQFLAVGDPIVEALHVYTIPDLEPVGTIDAISPQAHAGFLALPDGTVLAVDEANARLVAIGVVDGGAQIVHEASVPASVTHVAVDPRMTFAAVGSTDTAAPITIVDLKTWEAITAPLADSGEVGVALSSDPATLYHRNDVLARAESYLIEDLLAGSVEPLATVDTGAAGHGEAFDPGTSRLYLATDDGVEAVQTDGPELEHLATYPWDASGRSGGRGYFQKVTFDGSHVVSYAADREAPETEWGTWQNDVWIADTETGEVIRAEIGTGLVYRFGLAERAALFFRIGTDGDEAVVVDLEPDSPDFGTVTSRIVLDPLTAGPADGSSPWEAESRIAAITPDGRWGFVSAGGDGNVIVLDLDAREIAATIEVPTPLSGGGQLAVFGTPVNFHDTIAR